MSVSNSVLYERTPRALRCKSYRLSQQPTGGNATFTSGQKIEIQIPSGRAGEYLDPSKTSLRYIIKNEGGTDVSAVNLDHNGSCVIKRIEVYSGSQRLETINQYSVLYSAMLDAQVTANDQIKGLSVSYGTNETNAGQGISLNSGSSVEIEMPLASALVGLMANKYLPLCKISSPIRIDLHLATDQEAFVFTTDKTTNTFEVSDVELRVGIVQLGEEAQAIVDSVNGKMGNILFSAKTFEHHTFSMTAGTSGSKTFSVDDRHASVNGLIFCFRNWATDKYGYSLSSRINPIDDSFQIRLGSTFIPTKPINLSTSCAEAWIETQKYYHSLDSVINYGSVSKTDYERVDVASATLTKANTYKNKFLLAIDTEAYSKKSDQLYDGLSSIGDSFYVNMNQLTLVQGVVADVFCNFDILYEIDLSTGVLTASF